MCRPSSLELPTGEKIMTAKQIAPGDVLLGLPSVGLHTNGYSLARKLFFEVAGTQPIRTSMNSE